MFTEDIRMQLGLAVERHLDTVNGTPVPSVLLALQQANQKLTHVNHIAHKPAKWFANWGPQPSAVRYFRVTDKVGATHG